MVLVLLEVNPRWNQLLLVVVQVEEVIVAQQELEGLLREERSTLLGEMAALEAVPAVPAVPALTAVLVELEIPMRLVETDQPLEEAVEVVKLTCFCFFLFRNPVVLVLTVKLLSPTYQAIVQKYQNHSLVLISGKLVRNAPFQLILKIPDRLHGVHPKLNLESDGQMVFFKPLTLLVWRWTKVEIIRFRLQPLQIREVTPLKLL
jgi:hypothetical protein